MNKILVDSLSSLNFNNGLVKMFFVSGDYSNVIAGESEEPKIVASDEVSMSLPGFMYLVSVVKNFLDDPKMKSQIEKYIELGLLPKAESSESE
jgi:hypothetical protein